MIFIITGKGKVTTDILNVRPQANRTKDPILTLSKNTIIDIIGETKEFYKIPQGYVSKDFVEVIPDEQLNAWKYSALKYLKAEGIQFDYAKWSKSIDEPMPAWAVFALMSRIYKKLKEEY